jgi:trans-2-enoyl-CoA reductase
MSGALALALALGRGACRRAAGAAGVSAAGSYSRGFAALRYAAHGDPFQMLSMGEDADVSQLQSGEVALKMLYAPVCDRDVESIEVGDGGASGEKVAGTLGVGEVTQVGPGVSGLTVGDWAIPSLGSAMGTWCNVAKGTAQSLLKVPKDIPAEYAGAVGGAPCAAYRLLRDIVPLKAGDTIIHSMGTSGAGAATGLAIIQMAKQMGLRTITVVEDRPEEDETLQVITSLGGEFVVYDDYLHTKDFYELIADLPAPCLSLDVLGGAAGTDMLRSLGKGGVHVRYGGAAQAASPFPASVTSRNNIKVVDYTVHKELAKLQPKEAQSMVDDICGMIKREELIMFFESHAFFLAGGALEKYYEPYLFRNVLLDMSAKPFQPSS